MTREELNPEIKFFLNKFNELMKNLPKDIPVSEGRKMYEQFAMIQAGVPLKIARVEDFTILNRAGDYQIPLRVYTPILNVTCPALLYFHGGGWQRGSINSHDSICRNLATKGQCIIISVEWRLAPEHKFPIGLNDCLDSYLWLLEHTSSYNIDPNRIAIGGDSAGGNLAAAIVLLLKEKAIKLPIFQILFYPSLDLSCNTQSYINYADDYFLTTERVKYYVNEYIGSPKEIENPLVSPLKASDLRGLPPTYIITAGFDPLRDEGKLYADKLKSFDVPVTYQCYEGMIHAFLHMTDTVSEVNKIFDEVSLMLKKGFSYDSSQSQ